MLSIKRFDFEENKLEWNLFVQNNLEGHFFFETDYLFYHKERFEDFSLLIYDKKNILKCILPACVEEKDGIKTLYSHKGLTFGGFVFRDKLSFLDKQKCVFTCLTFLKQNSFDELIIKTLPSYFSIDESIHRLLNKNFSTNSIKIKILRVEANSVIMLPRSEVDFQKTTYQNYSKRKKRNLKKAYQSNLRIDKTQKSIDFWKIVENNLKLRHHLLPVHSATEIQLLHDKFPQNILFSLVRDSKSEIVACSVSFINRATIHLQYMAATKKGREINALDFLINHFVENHTVHFDKISKNTPTGSFDYLSLGVSELRNNDNKSKNKDSINENLFKWKEEFGAKTFSHFVYQIEL